MNTKRWFIGGLLFLSSINLSLSDSHIDVVGMMNDICDHSAMTTPPFGVSTYPIIYQSTAEYLNTIICCGATAVTYRNQIYLSEFIDLNTVKGQSVLYHELVHVVQNYNNLTAKNCNDWVRNEIQAYELQRQWAVKHGFDLEIEKSIEKSKRFCVDEE